MTWARAAIFYGSDEGQQTERCFDVCVLLLLCA
jgi:hypothetical protein